MVLRLVSLAQYELIRNVGWPTNPAVMLPMALQHTCRVFAPGMCVCMH